METIIDNPNNIAPELLNKVLDLIEKGGEIPDIKELKNRILNADLIAIMVDNEKVVTTATIKNPNKFYTTDVFKSANSKQSPHLYLKELGYIVTNSEYEGKKMCQALLQTLKPEINKHRIFATTRKDSMAHILKKNGFRKDGNVYKHNLNLFVFDS